MNAIPPSAASPARQVYYKVEHVIMYLLIIQFPNCIVKVISTLSLTLPVWKMTRSKEKYSS